MYTLTERKYKELRDEAETLVMSPNDDDNFEGITMLNTLSRLDKFS